MICICSKSGPESVLIMYLLHCCRYYHDIIYVLAFVQIGSVFSDKFWYILLVVSLRSLYSVPGDVIVVVLVGFHLSDAPCLFYF